MLRRKTLADAHNEMKRNAQKNDITHTKNPSFRVHSGMRTTGYGKHTHKKIRTRTRSTYTDTVCTIFFWSSSIYIFFCAFFLLLRFRTDRGTQHPDENEWCVCRISALVAVSPATTVERRAVRVAWLLDAVAAVAAAQAPAPPPPRCELAHSFRFVVVAVVVVVVRWQRQAAESKSATCTLARSSRVSPAQSRMHNTV